MVSNTKSRTKKPAHARSPRALIEQLPADRLFRIADAAESIADNLRALALPNAEEWLKKSVVDWYEMTGRELRSLGLMK